MLVFFLLYGKETLGQCTEATKNSVTVFLFDLKSPDISQELLNKFLDRLTFKLNSGIRQDLNQRGLLGNRGFNVKWCSGTQVGSAEEAISTGKKLLSPGVMWGFIDQGAGQLKSALNLTSLIDKPLTGLSNIVYGKEPRLLVTDTYLAFSAYIVGKDHLRRGDAALARKCFLYAKDLKGLPDVLAADMSTTLANIEKSNLAKQLKPIGEKK